MRILSLLSALTLVALLPTNSAHAAPGDLDPTFGSGGKVTTPIGLRAYGRAVAIDSNGLLLVAGYSETGSAAVSALARYDSSGSLDPTFGIGGKVTTALGSQGEFVSNTVAVDSVGRTIVAGHVRNGSGLFDFALARYLTGGDLDPTFGTSGTVTTPIGSSADANAIAIDTSGRIVAAGTAMTVFGVGVALVRYNSSGNLDPTFGSGGTVTTMIGSQAQGYAVAIDGIGRIIVAGGASNGSNYDFALARYHSSGSLDPTFGIGGKVTTALGAYDEIGWSVAIDGTGRIVVGGYSSNGSVNAFALARYDSSGSLDPTFGTSGTVTAPIGWSTVGKAVAIDTTGRIVVAGYSSSPNNFASARFDSNGNLDLTFGTGGTVTTPIGAYDIGHAVAIDSSGRIVVAGSSESGSRTNIALVRYQGGPTCGNAVFELGESCDDGNTASGDCCSAICQFETGPQLGCSDGISCTVDICNGAGVCVSTPDDVACDDGEVCSIDVCSLTTGCGHTPASPAITCRMLAGDCDVAESCDGASLTCPADVFASSSTLCRVAVGECDVPEACTGSNAACPEDGFQPIGFECAADSEVCTLDVCDGADACTHPAGNAGVTCRAAAGPCDVSEVCDGTATSCPEDGFASASTTCRSAAAICDVAENCTGSSPGCPLDAIQPTSVECRSVAGGCDVAETCDGVGVTCPTDTGLPDSDGDAVCDAQDVCTNVAGDRNLAIKPKLLVAKVNTDPTPGKAMSRSLLNFG